MYYRRFYSGETEAKVAHAACLSLDSMDCSSLRCTRDAIVLFYRFSETVAFLALLFSYPVTGYEVN